VNIPRHLISVVASLMLAGPGLAARAAAIDDRPDDADRAAIVALGKEIGARLDASELARVARDQAEVAALRARADLDNAEKTRMVAEISVKEYLEGSYPQDVQTAVGEIKLAESDLLKAVDVLDFVEKMRDKNMLDGTKVLAARMSQQKCEIGLQNAKKKLEVLQTFTKIKQTTKLEANVKKCESNERWKGQARLVADNALAAAKRHLAVEGTTEGETRAIVALDEAITLFDEGKAGPARARLDAAKMLWREGQESRAKAQFTAVKDRVRAEAAKVRGGK
jgi:hypothetical protein